MLEHLTTYLDINQITPAKGVLSAGKEIEQNPSKKLINLAKKGYILEAFQQLCLGKITLDEFIIMGDLGSERAIYTWNNLIDDLEIYLETLMKAAPEKISDAMVIIDQDISTWLKKKVTENKTVLLEI